MTKSSFLPLSFPSPLQTLGQAFVGQEEDAPSKKMCSQSQVPWKPIGNPALLATDEPAPFEGVRVTGISGP